MNTEICLGKKKKKVRCQVEYLYSDFFSSPAGESPGKHYSVFDPRSLSRCETSTNHIRSTPLCAIYGKEAFLLFFCMTFPLFCVIVYVNAQVCT